MENRNKVYKLIAIDMDGTLLNSKKEVLPETATSIEKALSAGKYVVFSTGRGTMELEDYKEQLSSIPYGICISGALIYDFIHQKPIHQDFLPAELVPEIMGIAAAEDPLVHFLMGDRSIVQADHVSNMNVFGMGVYQELFDRVATKVDDIRKETAYFDKIHKLNLYHRSMEARNRNYERLKHLPLSMAFAEDTSIEISPDGISKASGLKRLCGYLGIDISETIAIGDGDNDRLILEAAGLSIAMGNAEQDILALCDEQVADNDHNGVGEAIERFLL